MIVDADVRLVVVSYLDAALNKIEVASYCQKRLAERLESGEAQRVEVQTYFEGLLYAGVAATDQLAEAGNRAFALRLSKPNLRAFVHALRQTRLSQPLTEFARDLEDWRENDTVREAGTVRRRATHHYYAKSVHDDTWFCEASDGIGVEETGSVGLLANAYLGQLDDLLKLIWRFAEAIGADDELKQQREEQPR
jgi:hypothetical protein